MEVRLGACPTGWAAGYDWLAQQEVEHRTDPPGHNETDRDPESETHRAAWGVLADVADHQDV
ncbi:hypothetical protein ACPOL_1537 [Acidisarcina polymorpha]|uniref:Uncharacterized protein n=1 Tax=Acidisarcina polymorpha TaxID=2211140 RepID=A0A2Z5FVG8_9BACT|nr:hypothetical protein ACPOL_1537 [Acidisarcina polymorpha]